MLGVAVIQKLVDVLLSHQYLLHVVSCGAVSGLQLFLFGSQRCVLLFQRIDGRQLRQLFLVKERLGSLAILNSFFMLGIILLAELAAFIFGVNVFGLYICAA